MRKVEENSNRNLYLFLWKRTLVRNTYRRRSMLSTLLPRLHMILFHEAFEGRG